MQLSIILCILLLVTVSGVSNHTSNYTIYRVTAFNARERSALYSINLKNRNVFFLNGVSNDAAIPMNVLVNDCCTEEFEMILQDHDIEYINHNKELLSKELNHMNYIYDRHTINNTEVPKLNEKFFDWISIILWIQKTLKKYPTLKKIVIGHSYEKREIVVLKISNGMYKPAVFILGGEQGRDWISPAVILNFIKYILTKRFDVLTKLYDLYFLPVFNPDGYEYSLKQDRLWNKNRKVFFPNKLCADNNYEIAAGVNIDRNWFFTKSTNVEDAECDAIYIGQKPLTEEETLALSNFLNTIAVNQMAFINLKGFQNVITVPYANADMISNNYAILMEMLRHAAYKVTEKYNVSYNLCSTANCFYNMTGNSPDWVKMSFNIPVVFTIYLKHDKTFFPHLDQIPMLTHQFTIILNETLFLADRIYGPLFNCHTHLTSSFKKVILIFLVGYIRL